MIRQRNSTCRVDTDVRFLESYCRNAELICKTLLKANYYYHLSTVVLVVYVCLKLLGKSILGWWAGEFDWMSKEVTAEGVVLVTG